MISYFGRWKMTKGQSLIWLGNMWLQVCVCAWMCACSCARRTARFLLRVLLVPCFFVGRLRQEEMSEACGKTKHCSPLGQEYIFREWKSTDCFLLMALIEIEPLFVSTFNRGMNHFNSPWTGHLHARSWQFWVFKDLKIGSNLPKDPPTCPSVRPATSQEMQIWDESLMLGLDTLIRDHIKTVWWNSHEITVQ